MSAGTSVKAQEVVNRYHYAIAHVKKIKEVGKNEVRTPHHAVHLWF